MVDAVVAVALDRLLQVLTSQGLQFIKFDREFEEVRTELLYINSFLKDAEKVKQVNQMEMLRTIMQDLREMVYDVEDIMEDFELHRLKCHGGYKLHCMGFSSLSSMKFYFEIGKRLRMVRERMTKARGRMTPYLGTALALPSQWPEWGRQPLRNPILVDEAGTVGLAEDQWKIRECLLEASGHLTVIGIVGMGGIGKTTLAQQIYNDRSLKEQYGYIIFLTVSQSFELKELIRTMLRKLNESEDSMRGDTADLLRTLHSKLDKKYLIILDDVWGADEGLWWESLKSGFPHRAGSCVIVTTRDEEVARSMGDTHRCMHHLRLLSEENGWSLFSKAVFERDGGQCPNMDLEVIGKEIVSQCRGLPLAIKIAGGMMVGKEKSAHKWSQISKHLKQELATHNKDKVIFSTLSLSYEELPTHLKPCFLSFAMFPEDTEIFVHTMIHW